MRVEKKPLKKEVIKLPWEQFTSFSEVLKALPGRQTEDDEEDEDELEAYEDTIQRLKVRVLAGIKVKVNRWGRKLMSGWACAVVRIGWHGRKRTR